MSSEKPSAMTIGEKMGHELRQFGLIAGYLYVCFGALILYKMAILRGQGIGYAPYGLAAVKALVLAKFILAGMQSESEIGTSGAASFISSPISRWSFSLCFSFYRSSRRPSQRFCTDGQSPLRSLKSREVRCRRSWQLA